MHPIGLFVALIFLFASVTILLLPSSTFSSLFHKHLGTTCPLVSYERDRLTAVLGCLAVVNLAVQKDTTHSIKRVCRDMGPVMDRHLTTSTITFFQNLLLRGRAGLIRAILTPYFTTIVP